MRFLQATSACGFVTKFAAVFFALAAFAQSACAATPFKTGDVFLRVVRGTGGSADEKIMRFSHDGELLDVINRGVNNNFGSGGMALDSGNNLYVGSERRSEVEKFDDLGNFVGLFGEGYRYPLSIVFDMNNNAYVGEAGADETSPLLKVSPEGTVVDSHLLAIDQTGGGGTMRMALAPDQCTLRYTDQGYAIKQYNVCDGVQLPDLLGSLSEGGRSTLLGGIVVRSNGETLVAGFYSVWRLDSQGAVIQVYQFAPNTTNLLGQNLALDPDNKTFLTVNSYENAPGVIYVYRVDIDTGAVVSTFNIATQGIKNQEGITAIAIAGEGKANQARLTASNPIIPQTSRVVHRSVLTRSDVIATVIGGDVPVSGVTVILRTDRPGDDDTVTQPSAATDAAGQTTGRVETRNQQGPSTISAAGSDLQTIQPAIIQWLPARYEANFLVTCYVISLESDFDGTRLIGPVNGLPVTEKYREGFINDVRLQGSGAANDGTIIRYNGRGTYGLDSCPRTATGACAVDGQTAAVDFSIIPRRGAIAIQGDGQWLAQDTGGAINGFHIDEYFGARRSDCLGAGRMTRVVEFVRY